MTPSPERLPCGDETPPREVRRRAAEALRAGEVVALPTETVYGLAARADDPAALDRLRALKGRDADRPLTWHVADRDPLERFDDLPGVVRRLGERYWPGPLTLVLRGVPEGLEGVASDGWVGLRLPAHRGAQAVLREAGVPVVATSANASGDPPATTPDAVAELFPEGLALLLDGGPCRMGEASGVLAVGRGRFELLREGLLPLEDLERTAGLRIGFCCTGNTCRSPMAEALARHHLEERCGADPLTFGYLLTSFGVAAAAGAPASAHAVQVLQDRGLDLGDHRSRPALPEIVAQLDHVYCLTSGHLEALRAALPPGRGKHLALLDPAGEDVPDPFGGPLEVYRACMERLDACLRARVDDWV